MSFNELSKMLYDWLDWNMLELEDEYNLLTTSIDMVGYKFQDLSADVTKDQLVKYAWDYI